MIFEGPNLLAKTSDFQLTEVGLVIRFQLNAFYLLIARENLLIFHLCSH